MATYNFLLIENCEGEFEVPGEIVKILTERPQAHDQFKALVKLDEEAMDTMGTTDESEMSVSSERVELTELPGVGEGTAENLEDSGFTHVADFRGAEPQLTEVDGVGPTTAEDIMDYIHEQ